MELVGVRLCWSRVGLVKRGKFFRERRPCEHGGRDRRDVSTGQGMLKFASKPPGAWGEVWNRSFLTASEGTNPVDALIFLTPELIGKPLCKLPSEWTVLGEL